ncbi:MAG: TolC family protein [Cytophagales bacterium]|nr:TolC family protein [Cytophagales bacterium]
MKKLFLLLVSGIISFGGYGQTKSLSLAEAVELASRNNGQIKASLHEVAEAEGKAKQAWANYLPHVGLSSDFVRTDDPLNVFGFRLMQGQVQASDFNPELLNAPSPLNNFQTKVTVQQPLFNWDGYLEQGAVKAQLKSKRFSAIRAKEAVLLAVKKQYFAVSLLDEQAKVVERALKTAKANQKVAQDNQEEGYLKEADLLEVNVYVLQIQSELLKVENQLQAARDYLLFMLQLPQETDLVLTDALEDLKVSRRPETKLSDFRTDVQAFAYGVKAMEKIHRASQLKFFPRLNAFGNLAWNSEQAFDGTQDNFMVGVRLSWSLFSGMRNWGGMKASQAKLAKMNQQFQDFRQQSQLELEKASRKIDLKTVQHQMGQEASRQAEENLRIRMDRFGEGLEKTSDLLQAQTLASQKKLEALRALYDLKISKLEFNFLQQ